MSRRINAPVFVFVPALALGLTLASREAHAVTVTVDANGACTLAEAVRTVHDIVLINPDPPPQQGCALSALGETGFKVFVVAANNHQVASTISVSVTMTIEGASRSMTTVRSNGRAITVQGHPTRNPTLTIRNITLQGATTPRSGTGVVLDTGFGATSGPAHLLLSNVRLTNYIGGLGVFSQINGHNVDAVVQDSLIELNDQAGIRSSNSSVSVTNSTIRSNNDGGIRATLDESDVGISVANSVIQGNFSAEPGGGIMVDGKDGTQPHLTVSNSTIQANRSNGDGGGIWLNGFADVSRSTIANNTGTNGGGVFVTSFGSDSNLAVRTTTFSGNAAANGGGLYLDGQGEPAVQSQVGQCLFTNNVAAVSGGGFFSTGQEDLDNNTFNANRAQFGAGIFHDGQEIHLRQNTIANNTASDVGGGVFVGTFSNPIVSSNVIADNAATNAHNDFVFAGGLPPEIQTPGSNLVETVAQDMLAAFPPQNNNIINTNAATDARLGPLQNLGGPTSVLPLLPGSRAIDAIPNLGILQAFDQRGVSRLRNGQPLDGNDAALNTPRTGIDMGAFEAPDNSALVADASASSQSMASRAPAMAKDRDANTRWESATNNSGTLTMLFSTRTIGSITLREFGNRITGYRIETRTGATWSTLITSTTIGANPKIHTFTPRSINGARIVVTGAGNQLPSIREFEIY